MLRLIYKFNKLISNNKHLLVSIVIFLAFSYSTTAQNQRDRIQQQKTRVEREITATNNLLEQAKKARRTNVNQLNLIQRQISNQERLLKVIGTELNNLNSEIGNLEKEITNLEHEIKLLKDEYAKMIYYTYLTRSSLHRLMFIFASESINKAYIRLRYLQEYAASRKRQVELIKAKQVEYEEMKSNLEKTRTEKFKVMKEQEGEKSKLDRQKRERDITISQLRSRERELLAELRKKQAESRKLQRQIEELIRREIEEARKRKDVKKVEGSAMPMTSAEIEISRGFAGNRGRMPWPVDNGVISSRFGQHPHPVIPGIMVNNNGIDIVTRDNTTVRAVFQGVVSAVFRLPNGNNAVILRHGDYLTVYSNLSAVNVKKNDQVRINQTLGTVRADNENNTTVFHFEVWREKNLENPETWLLNR